MTRVLIVDDESRFRSVLVSMLQARFELDQAASGEEAIFLMTKRPYDIVLLDTDMPYTDGWEVLQVIKDKDNWPSTRVIMLTLDPEPELALKAWNLGADDYVVKSFNKSAILAGVVDRAATALSNPQ